jgi:hypothetical protein
LGAPEAIHGYSLSGVVVGIRRPAVARRRRFQSGCGRGWVAGPDRGLQTLGPIACRRLASYSPEAAGWRQQASHHQ